MRHQCSKIGFWLGVTMMTKKSRMRKKASENQYHIHKKGVTLRWLILKEHAIPDLMDVGRAKSMQIWRMK